MKKNLFIGALAVFALTACSQDEVVDVNNYGNEISFTQATTSNSRATDYWCNNHKPSTIKVWAYTADNSNADVNSYFATAGETYTDNNSGKYVQNAQRYWPETTPLNFYAIAGFTATGSNKDPEHATKGMTWTYTVNDDINKQEDLLYAAELNCTKPVKENGAQSTGIQPLNFRHALSQIVFKAKLGTMKNIHVEVKSVEVVNANNTGTFAWSASTADNYVDHNDSDVTDENNNNEGTTPARYNGSWSDVSGSAKYNTYLNSNLKLTTEAQNITTEYTDSENGSFTGNALLLMPQNQSKNTNFTVSKNGNNVTATGPCLRVGCCIYNIANDTFNKDTDVAIHGTQEVPDNIWIPLDFNWKPGKKYIYTIVFGGDNSGPGIDDNNDDILTPISYSITVDDFDLVDNSDVEGFTKK